MKSFFSIAIILVLNTDYLFGQKKTVIWDSTLVSFMPAYENASLDSLVYIKSEDRWKLQYEIFYDSLFRNLAYKSIIIKDTCKIWQFYRSGKLKSLTLYVYDLPNEEPSWFYQELYCKNGQIIRKEFPNMTSEQLIVEYYCNGNKKLQFIKKGLGAVGKMETWYDNGVKSRDAFWKDYQEHGEWVYFNIDGKVNYIENYENGKLINSSKK